MFNITRKKHEFAKPAEVHMNGLNGEELATLQDLPWDGLKLWTKAPQEFLM